MKTYALVLMIALSPSAMAEEIHLPALEGQGNSDQSLELAGGATNATIDSGGSIGISGNGVSGPGHLAVTAAGQRTAVSGGNPTSPEIDGPATGIAPVTVQNSPVALTQHTSCLQIEARNLSASQIAAIRPQEMHLVEICPIQAISQAQRAALGDNQPLLSWLNAKGYAPNQISGLALSSDRKTLLVSRAKAAQP